MPQFLDDALKYDDLAVRAAKLMVRLTAFAGCQYDDLLQTARLGLYEALQRAAVTTDVLLSFEAWATVIIQRRLYDLVHNYKDRLASELPEGVADEGPSPEDLAVRAARNTHLADAMGKLEPREQTILNLFYTQDGNSTTIGAAMSPCLSPARVRQLHAEALLRLRCWLASDRELFED